MKRFLELFLIPSLFALSLCFLPAAHAQLSTSDPYPTNGWQSSSPEEQGIDSAQLVSALDQLSNFPHSLMIIRHGYVVLDVSSFPFKSSQQHALFSVTKSFVSALVGIAIDKGLIKGVDQSIWDFFRQS